jgi:hypothetical protein
MVKTGLFGAAVGAGAGAIVGGLLDAGNPARKIIFERTNLSIAPVITRRSKSVSFVFRW